MDRNFLAALQRGIPLTPRPFQVLAKQFQMTEEQVLQKIIQAFEDKTFRRFGAVFEGSRLNYRSMLCAINSIPQCKFEEILDILKSYSNITHIYRRGWIEELPKEHFGYMADEYPEIWFTWSEYAPVFDDELMKLKEKITPAVIFEMPALLRFKIQVLFDLGDQKLNNQIVSQEVEVFSEREKKLIRYLQGNIPVTSNLFEAIGNVCAWSEKDVINQISLWQEKGIIRRFAIIPRHQKLGFKANAMGLWNVSQEEAEILGPILADNAEVTHCYYRQTFPGFPYGLYAMIHGKTWDELLVIFEKLSKKIQCYQGKMLCSLEEYKKTSMSYFTRNS